VNSSINRLMHAANSLFGWIYSLVYDVTLIRQFGCFGPQEFLMCRREQIYMKVTNAGAVP